MATRTKRQHFVPRFYLAHFADNNELVWTYDTLEAAVRSSKPEQTAVESNFYSPADNEGNYNDSLETWLSQVESDGAALYPRVLRGDPLEGNERQRFAVFLASLFGRSPAMITAYAEMQGYSAQLLTQFSAADPKIFEAQMNDFDSHCGRTTSPNERNELREFIKDTSRYTMHINRKAGLAAIGVTDTVAPILHDMRWMVLDSPEQHIITSDNPLVRTCPPESFHPIFGDGGFMNKRAEIYIPLSSSKVLLSFWPTADTPNVCPIKKEQARHINRLQAHFCERYLFASRHDAGIISLSKKFNRPGLRLRVSGQDKLANVTVKRRIR